jgi:hypothetical protein
MSHHLFRFIGSSELCKSQLCWYLRRRNVTSELFIDCASCHMCWSHILIVIRSKKVCRQPLGSKTAKRKRVPLSNLEYLHFGSRTMEERDVWVINIYYFLTFNLVFFVHFRPGYPNSRKTPYPATLRSQAWWINGHILYVIFA